MNRDYRKIEMLDGSVGVELMRRGFKGNLDALNLTHPDVVRQVHRSYLDAGADIITTNTFNAQALTQGGSGMARHFADINRVGAEIAREEAERAMGGNTSRHRILVAGSIGPTALSVSAIVGAEERLAAYRRLEAAYEEQVEALSRGGADILLIETVYDAENAKAALEAVRRVADSSLRRLPLMVSMSIDHATGRIYTGQTPEEMLAIVDPYRPEAVGFNCSGPSGMAQELRKLRAISPYRIIAYPNAGFPDAAGHYAVGPEEFAACVAGMAQEGLADIVGGCCGTGPEHIRRLAAAIGRCG